MDIGELLIDLYATKVWWLSIAWPTGLVVGFIGIVSWLGR